MRRKIFEYFRIAAQTATSKLDERVYMIGAVGERSDGTLVKSLNGPCRHPERLAHAEYRLSRKLDVGSVVYVARVRGGDGNFGMARPCASCAKALGGRGVRKVYYTISNEEYGVLEL